jgi:hypothetical protein
MHCLTHMATMRSRGQGTHRDDRYLERSYTPDRVQFAEKMRHDDLETAEQERT